MNRLRLVALTVALTSAFWLAMGAWWSLRQVAPDRIVSTDGAIFPPVHETSRSPVSPTPSDRAARPGAVDSHLLIPVAGVKAADLVDTFTQSRAGGARHHDAIDIPAPSGTPVIAAAEGIVEKLFTSDEGGKTVYVRSPDRTRLYYYAHLHAYARGLSEGQVVGAGDQLGSVGSTGNASGNAPHLHFEVMVIAPDRDWFEDKRPLNPYPLLAGRQNGSR